jgi:hypothetical protein
MINGEREECSMQMKLHSPNGMGDTQLNRKNRGGQDQKTSFSNKLLSIYGTQVKKRTIG